MNFFNHYISAAPNWMNYQSAALTTLPDCFEVADHWHHYGLGVGRKACEAGLGEFYERRHFYHEIFPDTKAALAETLTHREAAAFVRAFTQTRSELIVTDDILSHPFEMSKVYRTADFSECLIPTACLSISAVNSAKDNKLYPLKDTCGCSFHSRPTTAILKCFAVNLSMF